MTPGLVKLIPSIATPGDTAERAAAFGSTAFVVATTGAYKLHLARGASPITMTCIAGAVYPISILGVWSTPSPAGVIYFLD